MLSLLHSNKLFRNTCILGKVVKKNSTRDTYILYLNLVTNNGWLLIIYHFLYHLCTLHMCVPTRFFSEPFEDKLCTSWLFTLKYFSFYFMIIGIISYTVTIQFLISFIYIDTLLPLPTVLSMFQFIS